MTKRAFLFPGQGAQYGTMGKDLAAAHPAARSVFDRASERLGFDLSKLCFEGSDDDLVPTDVQQPAILTHAIAAVEALKATHGDAAVAAEAAAGLSLGEYGALIFAGVLTFEDGVHLVRRRGQLMQAACERYPQSMAAILKLDRHSVHAICEKAHAETKDQCVLGNILGDVNITISGGTRAIERAVALAKEEGGRALVLDVAGAFHSPYMQPAEDELADEIRATTFSEPTIPVICNVDGQPTRDVERMRSNLVKQLTQPVMWADTIQRLIDDGVTQFVEVGPGKALTGTLKRIAPENAVLVNVEKAADVDGFSVSG